MNCFTGKSPLKLLLGYKARAMNDLLLSIAVTENVVKKDLTQLRQETATKIQETQIKQNTYFDAKRKISKIYKMED